MVNKKYQDQEIFGSLKVNGTLTAEDASTLSVAHAVTADNADRATNNEDGYRIKDIYLEKVGPDLTVGTPIGALSSSSGKTYLDCSIGPLTVSSGIYYFYNCTGSITINSSTVKLYLTNCPNLTINGKTTSNWQNIWIDGVASQPNGVVTQYSNGTMIISETTYPNTSGTIQYTFPVAFIAEPVTNITVFFNSRYPSIERQTETFVKYTVWWEAGQANAEYVNIRAIGRWK